MPTPRRYLVTAGNTRERIDSVRDWGNVFSGRTGYSIAQALAAFGEVDLLTSNVAHLAEVAVGATPFAIHGSAFHSHAELRGALAALMVRTEYDAVFMSAAVSDYKPQGVFAVLDRKTDPADPQAQTWQVRDVQSGNVPSGKVKSTHPAIAVLGLPTEKLIDLFRTEWGFRRTLVKFKLEVGISRDELLKIGQASRLASGADYLVANTLEMVGGDEAGAFLISADGHEWIPRSDLAARLAVLVQR